MPDVHPTAILDGDVQLADDVSIGPYTIIKGTVRIGAGTRIAGQAWLQGPLTIGSGNRIWPSVQLGCAPQSIAYDPDEPGLGVVIGDDNTMREGVTVHRPMTEDGPTRIGDGNFLMSNSHIGHDAQVGSKIIMATGAVVGGHAVIGDRVNMGGNTAVHQFVRVGASAMMGGLSAASLDIPPRFMLTAINVVGTVNVIGMRRSGMSRADIDTVKWVHRIACRGELSRSSLLEQLRARADDPIVQEYLEFFETCTRGWCTAKGQRMRGQS